MNDRHGIGGNLPPEQIDEEAESLRRTDPANLLVIPVTLLPKLFDVQFPALRPRSEELLAQAVQWVTDHTDQDHKPIPIADDAELSELSALMKQISDFAKDYGEVDTARKQCKALLLEAGHVLDSWFNSLRQRLTDVHGRGANAAVGTLQYAENTYLREKASGNPADAKTVGPLTTTSLAGSWDVDETKVNMMELLEAIVIGAAPIGFVMLDVRTVRAAIRRRVDPLRHCPGLVIRQELSARRR